jgi:hypothetical protein
MLAFSPTLVFYSRTLAGAVPGLAGLGATLLAIEYAGRGQDRAARLLGMAGVAVALTSSPWAYTALLAGLVLYGLGVVARRRGDRWADWSALTTRTASLLGERRLWLGLGLAVALLSTALLMRLGGLQATADLLAIWAARLLPGSGGRAFGYPLAILLFYETGTLALGVAGLVIGLRRRSLWTAFLGLWGGLVLVQATLSGAQDGELVAQAVLPLALLGGVAVEDLIARLRPAQPVWVGGALAVLSVLVGFWWLQLASFFNPEAVALLGSYVQAVWFLCLATPVVIAAAGAVLWRWVGRSETLWAAALLGLGLAGCLLVRNSISLNHVFARDPREPLVVSATSVDVRDMVAFLEAWSVRTALDQHALTIAVGPDLEPLVPWYLRDFGALRLSAAPRDMATADALVTVGVVEGSSTVGYASTTYRLRNVCDAPLADAYSAFGWWLLRVGGGAVRPETCRLWVRP